MRKRNWIERLIGLRERKLRSEIASLKSRVAALRDVERLRGKARSAACDAISSAALADLGPLGETRLSSGRQAGTLKQQVASAGEKVNHAKKLHESALEVDRDLRSRELDRRERGFELEAENFAGWRTVPGVRR